MTGLFVVVAAVLAVAEGVQSLSYAAQGIGRLAARVAGRGRGRGPRAC